MPLSALERLQLLLRPPGRGIYVHTTGGQYALPILQQLYGSSDEATINDRWAASLQSIAKAKTLVVGIPCDTGTGMLRGTNFGPVGVRLAYLKRFGQYPAGTLDVGDVLSIPQLLHDSMYNDATIQRVRASIHPGVKEALPVSPMSVAQDAYQLLLQLNPEANLAIVGGDHGFTWPAMLYCHERFGNSFGVLQLDAHDDLSPDRLGIEFCYSTWAHNTFEQRLLKPQHFVQVGLRNSDHTAAEWMKIHSMQQIWMDEIHGREEQTIDRVVAHFQSVGVQHLYITNDIDGTDPMYAPATGTPEPDGMTPQFIERITTRMGRHFKVFGGDVMEVAPYLIGGPETCALGAQYLHTLLGTLSASHSP